MIHKPTRQGSDTIVEEAILRWSIIAAVCMVIPVFLLTRASYLPLTQDEHARIVVMTWFATAVVWVPQIVTITIGIFRYQSPAWTLWLATPIFVLVLYGYLLIKG